MIALQIINGNSFDIFALEEAGKCEILDFFGFLSSTEPKIFFKLIKDLDWTADKGLLQNPEKFKHLRDDIYEFKTTRSARILCFIDKQGIVVLTNGFMRGKNYNSAIGHASALKRKYDDAKLNGYLTYREETL